MRLPDFYYTQQSLDGQVSPEANSTTPEFYQGDSIELDVYLNIDNQPVLENDWNIKAIVKKNVYANNIIWQGEYRNGIEKNDTAGYYKITIPSVVTSTSLAGTYWMDVVVTEKNGKGTTDRSFVVVHQPFMLNYTVASPHPTSSSPYSGLRRGNVEPTMPFPEDITRM